MKTEKNILVAFILNLAFSVFEFIGGLVTGSVAILSDAVHDIGDACSIGLSWFLERKSQKQPDENYTYGYARYSVLGGVITSLILLLGSALVVYNAIARLAEPKPINYDGMLLFAVLGVCVNFVAAYVTHGGKSLNQKAVNLHMLEDVLGWVVVLLGAVVMRLTDWWFLDPILSIGVAVFILINAVKNLREAADLFLEKTPHGVDTKELKEHICEIAGVLDVHHIHIWSLDGQRNYATMHIVTNKDPQQMKNAVRQELTEHGITHVTLELEAENEPCQEKLCRVEPTECGHHHHHIML